ncbi:heavy metal-associated domain-containing protein [Clostridium sp. KNHs214]|uniref:heavy-metal-associated domain-containing protein n=1 Tax=Clostridium sp. KNHs214 TaxID=1540257 RepID=UPI000553EF00|nr:heavy metal-associated domain-containing protein [Clostridium sp. KNHs214]
MKNSHYEVSGLANSQDKTKVLNALDKLEGVQEVAVDLGRGSIEIEYNSPATKEKILKCIENTGYTVKLDMLK